MAFQAVEMWMGYPPALSAAAPAHGQVTLASGTRRLATIIRVPKTGTLDKFEMMTGTVTNNPDNGIRFSFQDVDTSTGLPDGTQDQFRDITGTFSAGTWQAPGLITSDGTDGGSKRSVTRGDLLACVIEFVTFVAGDDIDWRTNNFHLGGERALSVNYYPATHNGTSWAKNTGANFTLALKYNDGTYGNVGNAIYPISTHNTHTYNTGSTPDERGLYFQLPSPVRVGGVWLRSDLDNAGDVVLYDSDGTSVLKTVSLTSAVRNLANGMNFYVPFATSVDLLASTNYRLVLKPTTGSNLSFYTSTVPGAAYLDAFTGGQSWHHTERTDAGSWSQTTTIRPWMGLEIIGIHDNATTASAGSHTFVG